MHGKQHNLMIYGLNNIINFLLLLKKKKNVINKTIEKEKLKGECH